MKRTLSKKNLIHLIELIRGNTWLLKILYKLGRQDEQLDLIKPSRILALRSIFHPAFFKTSNPEYSWLSLHLLILSLSKSASFIHIIKHITTSDGFCIFRVVAFDDLLYFLEFFLLRFGAKMAKAADGRPVATPNKWFIFDFAQFQYLLQLRSKYIPFYSLPQILLTEKLLLRVELIIDVIVL